MTQCFVKYCGLCSHFSFLFILGSQYPVSLGPWLQLDNKSLAAATAVPVAVKGKTLFHGQKLDGLVHLACLREFFKILDVLGQNEISYVIFG